MMTETYRRTSCPGAHRTHDPLGLDLVKIVMLVLGHLLDWLGNSHVDNRLGVALQ